MGHKGASEQIMFQSPHQSQEAHKKKGDGKLERVINLEEPSPTTMVHFKIKASSTFCKAINTLYL